MVDLHPHVDARFDCPIDGAPLAPTGFLIPGMRVLATLECPACGRRWFGELAAAHARSRPLLLGEDGDVHGSPPGYWSAAWLRTSFAERSRTPVPVEVESTRRATDVVLLNCLDALYGHALLKLLNAQRHLDRGDELVVLVPRYLRWLVPDGVAATWTVDLPLDRGADWNDALAVEVDRLVRQHERVRVSEALPHPSPRDVTIERFTRVAPFPRDEWHGRAPAVTFAWRDDRGWSPLGTRAALLARVGVHPDPQAALATLLRLLRDGLPGVDLAVTGIGAPGGLPAFVADERRPTLDETAERKWCARYARSHVVVGVHGSNMLLPSAHAGAVVELMPSASWPNLVQDLLLRPSDDARTALFDHRVLAGSASPDEVAACIASLIRDRPDAVAHFS